MTPEMQRALRLNLVGLQPQRGRLDGAQVALPIPGRDFPRLLTDAVIQSLIRCHLSHDIGRSPHRLVEAIASGLDDIRHTREMAQIPGLNEPLHRVHPPTGAQGSQEPVLEPVDPSPLLIGNRVLHSSILAVERRETVVYQSLSGDRGEGVLQPRESGVLALLGTLALPSESLLASQAPLASAGLCVSRCGHDCLALVRHDLAIRSEASA